MQINGPTPTNGYNQVQPVRGPVKPAHFHVLAANRVAESSAELTLSSEAISRLDPSARAQTDSRASRIAEIRAQLAEGSYETTEKLEMAVDRMLERIG